jgi:hypothetical protein
MAEIFDPSLKERLIQTAWPEGGSPRFGTSDLKFSFAWTDPL